MCLYGAGGSAVCVCKVQEGVQSVKCRECSLCKVEGVKSVCVRCRRECSV